MVKAWVNIRSAWQQHAAAQTQQLRKSGIILCRRQQYRQCASLHDSFTIDMINAVILIMSGTMVTAKHCDNRLFHEWLSFYSSLR
jgi:RNase P/RNase MRP subunit POP5